MKKKISFILIVLAFLTINVQAESYDGEYSIDYLLRNYNIVTLGHNDSGQLYGPQSIEGAILVNGDYTYNINNMNSDFGINTGNVKSFIKGTIGENITSHSEVVTDQNYIDFNKLYTQVMIESQTLADQSTKGISSAKIEISEPGIYTIKNTSMFNYDLNTHNTTYNTILINNYEKDSFYVFNYYNTNISCGELPNIDIIEKSSPDKISLKDYIESGKYTGNIIFNFPNAKNISICYSHYTYNNQYIYYDDVDGFLGSIIAPQANINISDNYQDRNSGIGLYYGTVICNKMDTRYLGNIKKANYNNSKTIIKEETSKYNKESVDYKDDIYDRDYSIKDLLQNYSLITLGHKEIDSKSKLLEFGNTPGSVKMFHITGQTLISGDLYGRVYENELDTLLQNQYGFQKFDRTAFDLESNKVTESYVQGNISMNIGSVNNNNRFIVPNSVIQPWDNMANDAKNYSGQKNDLIIGHQTSSFSYSSYLNSSYGAGTFTYITDENNYINFDRLYENVTAEQKGIEEGKTLKVGEDGTVHIPIGGSYTIEDISNVKEVVFDNFDKNKDELTIVTVKNQGDINFPLISKDTGSYKEIVTNDYYGKEAATHLYEQDTFVQDDYYGNIVWNVPNATYITLKENAPFAGHLIAPNADVDTPETHFAGCFIVNSIYGEGNTEAHFYPITAQLKCDCEGYENLNEDMKRRFSEYRLSKLLGGDASTIETTILGDEAQYRADEATLENVLNECPSNNRSSGNPIVNILTNPKTYRNLGFILVFGGLITYTIINKKKQKLEK